METTHAQLNQPVNPNPNPTPPNKAALLLHDTAALCSARPIITLLPVT